MGRSGADIQAACPGAKVEKGLAVVFTGDLLTEEMLTQLEAECEKFIPKEHMPKMCYEEDTNPYYLQGMDEKAMEIGGKW